MHATAVTVIVVLGFAAQASADEWSDRSFIVSPDCGHSLTAEDYKDVEVDLMANFPDDCRPGARTFYLIPTRRDPSTTDGSYIRPLPVGFRPATYGELRAFGLAYPDVQNHIVVVARGSTWKHPGGAIGVPFLSNTKKGRLLDAINFDWAHGDNVYNLAVHE